MKAILERLEQAGYADADGQLLTNDRDWHALTQLVHAHPGWPGLDVPEWGLTERAEPEDAEAIASAAKTREKIAASFKAIPLRFPNNERLQTIFQDCLLTRGNMQAPPFIANWFRKGRLNEEAPRMQLTAQYAAWCAGQHARKLQEEGKP